MSKTLLQVHSGGGASLASILAREQALYIHSNRIERRIPSAARDGLHPLGA